jgi:ACS family tartrate transporter-like MFS transporter
MTSPASGASPSGSFESRTIRKIQLRLLPFLFLLFVIAFIDRINLGFAAFTMNKELGIDAGQYGLAAGIFFFGYFLFEIPSNLLLHKIGARIWIARILLTWGVLATLTGFVTSVRQLYVARFLLGFAEAGYFPGIVLYLTYWFRQRDQAKAVALFLAGLPVTSIVGAPLSGMILDHVHWLGLSGWRWLLVLEGLPAIAFGVLTYVVLPNRPEDASFLTTEEKTWLRDDLRREEQAKLERHSPSVLQSLRSARLWRLTAIHFGMMIGLYILSFWAPQLVKSLSGTYSNTVVGAVVMIPHLAGLVAMVLVARHSDRTMERRYHAAIPALLGGTALLLMGTSPPPWVSLLLLSLLAIGVYSYVAPFWALPNRFLTGYGAAAGIGLINSVANLGGFAGPYAIGIATRATGSTYLGLALAGLPLIASGGMLLLLPKDH